jgi:hypothetical protein
VQSFQQQTRSPVLREYITWCVKMMPASKSMGTIFMALTPPLPHTMSRNSFESIWQAWHFSDNSQKIQDSGQLFKIWPVYVYYL